MRYFSLRRRLLATPLFLFALGATHAQVPPTQSAKGIDFIMGGIGSDESRALLAESKWWPLTIEFSEHTTDGDVWISDARVRIANATDQTIFDQVCDGPMLLVNLPPGGYTIAAQHKASIKVQKIQVVKGESRRISMHW
ncbi:MAG: hypothetical protein IT507_05460 [Burkholderiaceae bacterium]|nr:hypothetical protein [Burkholderiaceae bacterium]